MRVFAKFVRAVVIIAILATMAAVGVAQFAPTSTGYNWRMRRADLSHHLEISDFVAIDERGGCQFLDSETGALQWLNLPEHDSLLYGCTSPWRDQDGRFEVVGRWIERENRETTGCPQKFGLARYKFPGGELLDHVELDIVPSSTPCWFPGGDARVLFTGTDGHLYQFAFDGATADRGSAEQTARSLRPLVWNCTQPGAGGVQLKDPIWPTDRRMKNRVVVSLTFLEQAEGHLAYVQPQIWWLQLDEDGTSIDAAGRLTTAPTDPGDDTEEHLPNITATRDRGLVLACLVRSRKEAKCYLRLDPITFDSQTGTPTVTTMTCVPSDGPIAAVPPLFSSDGRWVHVVHQSGGFWTRTRRISVAGALPLTPHLGGVGTSG